MLSHRVTGAPDISLVTDLLSRRPEFRVSFLPQWDRPGHAIQGMVAALTGDADGTREPYEILAQCQVGMDITAGMSIGRVLGQLARVMGNVAKARTHFQDAIDFCRNAGYSPELAWTCSDYSEMLLEASEPGDREKAVELQDEAISIAQELGMKPLLERVLAQRQMLSA